MMKKLSGFWKKVGYLFLNFVLLFGLLRLIIKLAEVLLIPTIYYVGVSLYFTAAAALAILYYVWNGFTLQKELPPPDALPESWDPDRRQAYLVRLAKTKERAKKLLYVLFPLVLVIAFSYIELWIF